MENIVNHLKILYPSISKYFDNSIYKKRNNFRLTYQTNKEKQYFHKIIQGYPLDFIITHINIFCKQYILSDIFKYNILQRKYNNENIKSIENIVNIEKVNINIIEK